MGLIKCTCLYRAEASADDTRGVLTVVARDPWCPAADLHVRTEAADHQPADDGPTS